MTTLAGLKVWCKKRLNAKTAELSVEQRDALLGIAAWAEQYQDSQFQEVIIDAVFSPPEIGLPADKLEKDRFTAILFGIWAWEIDHSLTMHQHNSDKLKNLFIEKQRQIYLTFDYLIPAEGVLLPDVDSEATHVLNLAREKGCSQHAIHVLRKTIEAARSAKKDMLKNIHDCTGVLQHLRHDYETSLADLENLRAEFLSKGENEAAVNAMLNTASIAVSVVTQIKIEEQRKKLDLASIVVDQAYRRINSVYLQEIHALHNADVIDDLSVKEVVSMLRNKMDVMISELHSLSVKYDDLSQIVSEMEDMLQADDKVKMLYVIETIEMNLHGNPELMDPHNMALKTAYDNCMEAFAVAMKKH